MTNQDTRHKLSEALGIPVECLDRVVTAVRKNLGRSVSDDELLKTIERNPETRKQFQEIYRGFYSVEIREIAKNFYLTFPEAEKLKNSVNQQLPFPVNDSDLLHIASLQGAEDFTEKQILELLKIYWIGQKLQISLEDAQKIPAQIQVRIGRIVTHDDLLNGLELGYLPHNVSGIYEFFDGEWNATQELAGFAGITGEEAWQIICKTRDTGSQSVPREETFSIIRKISERNRKPEVIEEIIDYQFIAQHFHYSLKEVDNLIKKFEKELNIPKPDTRKQIVEAVPYVPLSNIEPPYEILKTLFLISGTCQKNLGEAHQFIEEAKTKAKRNVLYSEITDAFNELSITSISIDSLVEKLYERELAYKLELPAPDVAKFLGFVSKEVGILITPEMVLNIEFPEELNTKDISEYFWQLQYPIPQIALILQISAKDVPATLKKVRERFRRSLKDEDVLHALQKLPQPYQNVPGLIEQLFLQWIASELQLMETEVIDFGEATCKKQFSYEKIALALEDLPATNRTLPDIYNLLITSVHWQKNSKNTMDIIQSALVTSEGETSLTHFWPFLQQLDPMLQNQADLTTFLNVYHWLKNDSIDPQAMNRVTIDLLTRGNQKRFRQYFAATCTPDKLNVKDFEHFLWLMKNPSTALNLLAPREQMNERWITHAYLQSILNPPRGEEDKAHQNQKRKLIAYKAECWKQIVSEEREYEIPSNGRAEITVPHFLADKFQLFSVRFVQEKINAPGLYVQFKFQEGQVLGVVQILPNGHIEGFHKLVNNSWFEALVEAIALSHYHDFVVPVQEYSQYTPKSYNPIRDPKRTSDRNYAPKSFPAKRIRVSRYSFRDWYESQEIARHHVRGHTRWVGTHFIADGEKQRQAKQAGVKLPRGYTWVVEHERGNINRYSKIQLNGEDLIQDTIFLPPPIASHNLERILFK